MIRRASAMALWTATTSIPSTSIEGMPSIAPRDEIRVSRVMSVMRVATPYRLFSMKKMVGTPCAAAMFIAS
jgi:hypothetical protein